MHNKSTGINHTTLKKCYRWKLSLLRGCYSFSSLKSRHVLNNICECRALPGEDQWPDPMAADAGLGPLPGPGVRSDTALIIKRE